MYYYRNDFPEDFDVLSRMLSEDELWESENTTQKIDINDFGDYRHSSGFLSIIKKEYDELVFHEGFASQRSTPYFDALERYVDDGTIPSNETISNLYRYYSSYSISDINISELHKKINDVVAWLIVDNTSINYPIVKTDNNDYYLSHDINNNYSIGGWTFMDYRNNSNMNNKNTIFYGHNLMNNTSFGGLSKIFTDKWYNKSNHKIMVLTDNHKYTYEIFSVYYFKAETYYITTKFYTNDEYKDFLDILKSRSIYNFNVSLDIDDKIITLSTCSDDNSGRKVIHARLVNID